MPRFWQPSPYSGSMTDVRGSRNLQVSHSRRRTVLLWVAAGAVAVAFAGWFVTHPAALPVSQDPVAVSAPLGQAVYVGIYRPEAGEGRTLHLSELTVDVDGEARVAALVCREGTVSVTSDPRAFCSRLDVATGAIVGPEDGMVLEILDDAPGEASIGPVEVSYRDGLQWGTQPVGPQKVEATFISR